MNNTTDNYEEEKCNAKIDRIIFKYILKIITNLNNIGD